MIDYYGLNDMVQCLIIIKYRMLQIDLCDDQSTIEYNGNCTVDPAKDTNQFSHSLIRFIIFCIFSIFTLFDIKVVDLLFVLRCG